MVRCPGARAAAGAVSILCALVAMPLTAQDGGVVTGTVVSAVTGEAVRGAEVILSGTHARDVVGPDGRFELELPGPGSFTLVVAAGGYRGVERDVEAGAGLTISLSPLPLLVPGFTVTSSRGIVRAGDAPAGVAVISGDELQRRHVTDVKDALPFAQGVTFNAGQMDIRGSSGISRGVGSRVLMLLDGHRVMGGVGSDIDFAVMPILDVERIEVVKGPHSSLWGANAMSGVVHVITRPQIDGSSTVARGYVGVFDTPTELQFSEDRLGMQGLQLQHSRRLGSASATLFVGREASDGFRQNGALERWRIRAKALLGAESSEPVELSVSWKSQEAEEAFTWLSSDRPLEVDPTQLGDWKRDTDLVVGLTLSPWATPGWRLDLRPALQHVRSQNHFHDNDDFHRSTRYAADAQLSRRTGGRHAVTFGAAGAQTAVISNFLQPNPRVTDLGLFAQDEIEFSSRLRASVGLRIDSHRASAVESALSLNPKAGLVLRPNPALSLRASVSRGYRAPSVSERYTSTTQFGFRVVPNLSLRGESAWAGELGATASVSGGRLWMDAGLFWNQYQDLIEVGAAPGEVLTFQFQNVSRARVGGVDAGVRVGVVPRRINVAANYLFLASRDLDSGLPLVYRSRHNVTTTVSGWHDVVALDFRYRSRPQEVLAYPLDERGAIALVDLRVAMEVRQLTVQTKIANLMQSRYVDVQERNPGASRSILVTVTSRF